jgi:hypothetical protein
VVEGRAAGSLWGGKPLQARVEGLFEESRK